MGTVYDQIAIEWLASTDELQVSDAGHDLDEDGRPVLLDQRDARDNHGHTAYSARILISIIDRFAIDCNRIKEA